ncbi:MAG: hypothetical protein AB7F43_09540 [Bacteriovoracia bacterium]
MRVVAEKVFLPKGQGSYGFKASIFSWNEKLLLKLETGPLEQTYKFDMLASELNPGEIQALLDEPQMVEKIQGAYIQMRQALDLFNKK